MDRFYTQTVLGTHEPMVASAPEPIHPNTHRLLVDDMLGTLTAYLRVCGYDTEYAGDRDVNIDEAILDIARTEDRLILTRDVELAHLAEHSILLQMKHVTDQLAELHRAGVILEPTDTPTRCGRCNTALEPVPTTAHTPDYAPNPTTIDVWQCPACDQYFWRGSHWDTMRATISTATHADQ